MKQPKFAFIVYASWPDGDCRICETPVFDDPLQTRNAAFDVAAEMVDKYGCEVKVYQVYINTLRTTNITSAFENERYTLRGLEYPG